MVYGTHEADFSVTSTVAYLTIYSGGLGDLAPQVMKALLLRWRVICALGACPVCSLVCAALGGTAALGAGLLQLQWILCARIIARSSSCSSSSSP